METINYTKLHQQINSGKKPFYNIKKNNDFKRLCIQMEISSERIRSSSLDVELYEWIKDHIEYQADGNAETRINYE